MDGSLQRRQSTLKPLLDFNEDAPGQARRPGMINSRSVFGVDKLWEQEMTKLKQIEAQEEEARRANELAEAAELEKKKKKKSKSRGKENDASPGYATPSEAVATPPAERVSMAPPTLPDIPRDITRRPRPAAEPDDDDSSVGPC